MARRSHFLSFSLLFLFTAAASRATAPASRHVDGFQIVHTYPHDPKAFTQGLIFIDGHLYESTGENGTSSLRMVDLQTGQVLQKHDVPAEFFAEGLTDWGSTLVQLTWQAHKGFVYDRFSFSQLRTFDYDGEGWGLTHDSMNLILSDGTSYLRFIDPKSFREIRRVQVKDESGSPVEQLNELEFVHGEIYANVWHSDEILRISPRNGKLLGRIDLTGIIDKHELQSREAVRHGIASAAAGARLVVPGKLWPKLFEIKVVPKP